ncbi:hypothetical protein Scep_010107 [Stephania cephalantha]|uniref:Uncharacterized protein n=1 Tax=Stephania cephalantha TaxID=152367 RepID=A0AAP0PGW9_9MAGN
MSSSEMGEPANLWKFISCAQGIPCVARISQPERVESCPTFSPRSNSSLINLSSHWRCKPSTYLCCTIFKLSSNDVLMLSCWILRRPSTTLYKVSNLPDCCQDVASKWNAQTQPSVSLFPQSA